MADELQPGDRVEWNTSEGLTHGHVVKRLTRSTQVGGTEIAATPDDSFYLVESTRTGKRAAYRGEQLGLRGSRSKQATA